MEETVRGWWWGSEGSKPLGAPHATTAPSHQSCMVTGVQKWLTPASPQGYQWLHHLGSEPIGRTRRKW